MKVVGLIAEYNPLHYGHQYQLEQIKQISKCDVLVVVMSGNMVQRGQFAVVDKWIRAEMALKSGADFIFELPLLASLQSADYFAEVGIQVLSLLGCTEVYFGTESADIIELTEYVQKIETLESSINEAMKTELSKGLSYAAAYQASIEKLMKSLSFSTSLPNHQLAIQYIKANRHLMKPMTLGAIQRINRVDGLYSATKVREKLVANQLQVNEIPKVTSELLSKTRVVQMNDYWALLKYRLLTHTPSSLRNIFGIREGIEMAILSRLKEVNAWDEMVNCLVSKRWTRATINRLLMAILVDIKSIEWEDYRKQFKDAPILRLLAYRESKNLFLKELRNEELTIISNWKKEYSERYLLQKRMDDIFSENLNFEIADQNIMRYPIKG